MGRVRYGAACWIHIGIIRKGGSGTFRIRRAGVRRAGSGPWGMKAAIRRRSRFRLGCVRLDARLPRCGPEHLRAGGRGWISPGSGWGSPTGPV